MIDYLIRRADSADWQLLKEIRLRSLADAPDAYATTLAEDEARADAEWIARAESPNVGQFLATTPDGESIGVAVGAPYTNYADAAGLFGMWVAPVARGQGVGRALVEAVVAWAAKENYQRILLDVADANDVAIRLYESCGFLPTGKTGALPLPRQQITEHQRALSLV